MCKTANRIAAVTVLVVFGSVVADDSKDARALIDRALNAAGGAEKLAQPRAYSFKQEMTEKTNKATAAVVTKTMYYFQPPNQYRREEESQRGGRPSKYVEVISGNRGWAKRDGVSQPLTLDTIKHPVEVQQGFGYKFILNLRDPAFTPALLGESRVGDRLVVGVKLTRPVGRGAEERRLFFDPQTHLLVKSELHAKLSVGGELASEQTWGDFRMIDGIAVPHRVTHVIRDKGGSTYERVYSDFHFEDKLDPHLFEAP
jgi:hypothetical protein